MANDDVDINVELKGVRRFDQDARRAARSIDNIGDQARQASRALRNLSKTSSTARLALGPLSFKAKTGALALGAFAAGLSKATVASLGFVEASATVVGGAGGIGAVGLTAMAQGFGVASLASKDLTDALGGNEAAMKRLTPAARSLFNTLTQKREKLKGTIGAALFPGLEKGTKSALKNFGVVNKVAGRTGRALGGLAGEAGGFLGSRKAGADFSTVGNANVKIITNLGHAALSLGNALRSVLVTAAPLAMWMSEQVDIGAHMLDNWIQQKRAGDGLTRFFARAKTDLSVLASIGGHGGRGILNLFGARDVDGRKTLQSLDRLSAGFERWTRGVKGKDLGQAIADQIPKAGGVIATALANTLGAAVPQAAKIFWQTFWDSDEAGKALIGSVLLKKAGVFGLLSKALSGKGKGKGKGLQSLVGRGSTPLNPLFVTVVGPRSVRSTVGSGARGPGKRVVGPLESTVKKALPVAAASSTALGAQAAAVLLPIAAGLGLGMSVPSGPRNPNLSPHGPVRGGKGLPIQLNVSVQTNSREIARASKQFDLAELARNAARVDRSFGSRSSGAGH